MAELLIIADDFTGALDAGVHFAVGGARIRVLPGTSYDFSAQGDAQVLVMNGDTRHLSPEAAYAVVYDAVRRAGEAGIACVYKKTDSALRGNVGAELAAAMDALGRETLVFAPAFPRMDRVVQNGVLYIAGTPVAESAFGKDPFEPVRASRIAEILSAQTGKPVRIHPAGGPPPEEPGIHVYDAATDGELLSLAARLGPAGLALSAGCSGFASALPAALGLEGSPPGPPARPRALFMVCGSVNPVTVRQMDLAEREGFPRVRLTEEQMMDEAWIETPSGEESIGAWLRLAKTSRLCILDVNRPGGTEARESGSFETARERVAGNLGRIVRRLLDRGLRSTLLCTGGDTLLALMRTLDVAELTPLGELAPGVVLTAFSYGGREHRLVAKSGGFGGPELLRALAGAGTDDIREK